MCSLLRGIFVGGNSMIYQKVIFANISPTRRWEQFNKIFLAGNYMKYPNCDRKLIFANILYHFVRSQLTKKRFFSWKLHEMSTFAHKTNSLKYFFLLKMD